MSHHKEKAEEKAEALKKPKMAFNKVLDSDKEAFNKILFHRQTCQPHYQILYLMTDPNLVAAMAPPAVKNNLEKNSFHYVEDGTSARYNDLDSRHCDDETKGGIQSPVVQEEPIFTMSHDVTEKSLPQHNENVGVNPVRYVTEGIKALDQLVTAIRYTLYNAVMDVKDVAESIVENIEMLACNNDQNYIAGVEECMNEIKQFVIKARKYDEGRNQMWADMDEFIQVVIELITSSRRNSRKKEFFELNRDVVGSSTGQYFNLNVYYKLTELSKLANLASATKPFASGEADSTGGEVVSVAGIKDESCLRSMLLKKLRMIPQQLFESRDSNGAYTVYSERGGGRGGGRRVRLKRVTKEIRARMKSRAEKEREGWTATDSSDDDEQYAHMYKQGIFKPTYMYMM